MLKIRDKSLTLWRFCFGEIIAKPAEASRLRMKCAFVGGILLNNNRL